MKVVDGFLLTLQVSYYCNIKNSVILWKSVRISNSIFIWGYTFDSFLQTWANGESGQILSLRDLCFCPEQNLLMLQFLHFEVFFSVDLDAMVQGMEHWEKRRKCLWENPLKCFGRDFASRAAHQQTPPPAITGCLQDWRQVVSRFVHVLWSSKVNLLPLISLTLDFLLD